MNFMNIKTLEFHWIDVFKVMPIYHRYTVETFYKTYQYRLPTRFFSRYGYTLRFKLIYAYTSYKAIWYASHSGHKRKSLHVRSWVGQMEQKMSNRRRSRANKGWSGWLGSLLAAWPTHAHYIARNEFTFVQYSLP